MIASPLLSYQKGQEALLLSIYLIIYMIFYIICVFNIARLHVAETDVQYSEAGTQIHALALDLHKFKQFSWYLASTVNITYNTKARIFGEQKSRNAFSNLPNHCILYTSLYSISADQQTAHIQIPEYL